MFIWQSILLFSIVILSPAVHMQCMLHQMDWKLEAPTLFASWQLLFIKIPAVLSGLRSQQNHCGDAMIKLICLIQRVLFKVYTERKTKKFFFLNCNKFYSSLASLKDFKTLNWIFLKIFLCVVIFPHGSRSTYPIEIIIK